jgi:hypothetical protein
VHHNLDRPILEDMDALPSVVPVYERDLKIEDYFIGYLKHPYLSVYTGRGCKSHCTFCLWPQTVGGHNYRTRSVQAVIDEIADAKRRFPQVKEFMFDDDTFTDEVYRQAPYSSHPNRDTRNATDMVYSSNNNSGSMLLVAVAPRGAGYAASFAIGLKLA